MIPLHLPVASVLSASPHAQALASLDLGFGRSARIWQNRHAHIISDAPEGHTFSFYIRGGQGACRMSTAE